MHCGRRSGAKAADRDNDGTLDVKELAPREEAAASQLKRVGLNGVSRSWNDRMLPTLIRSSLGNIGATIMGSTADKASGLANEAIGKAKQSVGNARCAAGK